MSSSVGANYCSSNVFVSLKARTIVLFFGTHYEAEWMNNTE